MSRIGEDTAADGLRPTPAVLDGLSGLPPAAGETHPEGARRMLGRREPP
ncbi:hypothetical protein [Streptomyces sp. NPDC057052]